MKKQILLLPFMAALMVSCDGQKAPSENANTENAVASDSIATPVEASNSLFDTNWAVVEINGNAVEYQTEGAHITFNSSENSVQGNAGCNSLNCPFTSEGNNLSIQEGALTKMMCPDQENEDAFIGVIHNVKSYQISNDTLCLFDADSNKVLTLVKK